MRETESLLLVEDDATTREVLTLLLEGAGWQVRTAATGEDAVLALRAAEVAPGVILADQRLPGLAGTALAEELQRCLRERGAEAVVLGMSASATERVEGYDAMLRKPFDAAEVARVYGEVRTRRGHAAPSEPVDGAWLYGEPEPASDTALPVLDTTVFLQLQKQMGTRAQGLYGFALADANDRIRHMAEAAAAGEADRFHTEAHALKGSCGMIGARRLAALAARAEQMTIPEARSGSGVGTSDAGVGVSKAGAAEGVPGIGRNPSGAGEVGPRELLSGMWLAADEIHLMLETLFPV